MGYRESLWVAERVLDHAAVTTALRPVIVRIGQLSGGKNGYWSTAEWVPSIVRSGEVVKALPYINEVSSLSFLSSPEAHSVSFLVVNLMVAS
jgi:thioester reductase-like protein